MAQSCETSSRKVFYFLPARFLSQLARFVSIKYLLLVDYLHARCNPIPLALFRMLFGFLMFLDVPQERGLSDADIRFGDPNFCFFPLFDWIQAPPVQQACVLYSIMWAGSIGMMLGLKYRLSCLLYLCPYVYFFLLDKSRWNNHSYLFGLFALLLTWSDAGKHLSIDALLTPRTEDCKGVPKWNYFILKFQIFLLYFYAGIKKLCDSDWLNGYSMKNLSRHFLFYPLKLVTDAETIDFYMVHMGGLIYDLSVGFMLNFDLSKKVAYLLSLMFHGLNSQIFNIGMFPYVCLASLILFTKPNEFPCVLFPSQCDVNKKEENMNKLKSKKSNKSANIVTRSRTQHLTTALLLCYISVQLMLPYSHSITQGYNTWTKGLYGYSWDMMINSWETLHQKVTVRNYETGEERYLDQDVWVTNDRWSSHSDMAVQYAACIARNLARYNITTIEIYMDVWKSLNGRFQQRMFDPRVNILSAPWSPFEEVTWVLPLLSQFSHYRDEYFQKIAKQVSNWTESSGNVIFICDFPGLYLENFLPLELDNVSLTVISGEIMIEQEGYPNITLSKSENSETVNGIRTGMFHKIHVLSMSFPSCYMYTYVNASKATEAKSEDLKNSSALDALAGVFSDFYDLVLEKIQDFKLSITLVINSHLNLAFHVPMVIRKNVNYLEGES